MAQDTTAAEIEFWQSVKNTKDSTELEAYLRAYPTGKFAPLARLRLKKLAVGIFPTLSDTSTKRQPFEPEMVRIPGGTFKMGCVSGKGCSKDEQPVHRVTVPSFYLGKYEVTFDEWDACVDAGGCSHKPKDNGWGRGNRPVINVSWNDALTYVKWLNKKTGKAYRLPSEAEWEYAARAKSKTSFWWGNKASHEYANYGKDQCCDGLAKGKDKWKYTAPVGSFSSNGFGVHDMHGNVWEWVKDCFHDSYKNVPTDGAANTTGSCDVRVLRGGSWVVDPRYLRSAYRGWVGPDKRGNYYGFRVASTLESSNPWDRGPVEHAT